MGLSNEGKESADPPESHSGGGKDLLYGWLVGRAAADLGLAQALATNEVHHGEQIKQVEERLLAQIRELKDRQSSYDTKNSNSAEIDVLKTEVERFGEWQRQFTSEQNQVVQLEAAIRAKLGELESRILEPMGSVPSGEINDVKFELKVLIDRIARAEFFIEHTLEPLRQRLDSLEGSAGPAQRAPDEQQQFDAILEQRIGTRLAEIAGELRQELGGGGAAQEQALLVDELAAFEDRVGRIERAALDGMADLTTEISALKMRLTEPDHAAESEDLAGKKIEAAIAGRLDPVHDKISAVIGSLEHREADIKELRGQIALLGNAVSDLGGVVDTHADWEAKRLEWVQGIEELISARMAVLQDQLAERIDVWAKGSLDRERFQEQVAPIVKRLDQIELSQQQAESFSTARVEQVATVLRAELNGLKAELKDQTVDASQTLIRAVEGALGAKIGELENLLASARQCDQGREALLSELQRTIQQLGDRLVLAESTAQQTHALMVNEAAQAEQLREGVTRELATLQAYVSDGAAVSSKIDSLAEGLNARIVEAEDQWSQKWATLADRDGEIAAIKIQVQNLLGMGAGKNTLQSAAPNRPLAPIGVTVGLSASKPPLETIPLGKTSASEPKSLLQSYDAVSEGSKDQRRQLQQRISADIERVRAELRKRAGMGR